jgi:hypothetical protein
MIAKKYDGYFDDDFDFPAFKEAPKEEKKLREVKLGKEGDKYSYIISGIFHPPEAGDYSFRTRSDDASYIILNGEMLTDDGNEHGMRTREGTVHLQGPAKITIFFGQNRGGAGLDFEWMGGRQDKWTRRLGLFTPEANPEFPPPMGPRFSSPSPWVCARRSTPGISMMILSSHRSRPPRRRRRR